MATYCIGDLHGCHKEFVSLLELINFDPAKDELILTGDLIGRGPLPVETMKEVLNLGSSVKSVLGNHDLNFLAIHYGFKTARPKDNLEVILNSPIREKIVNFFVNCPLMYMDKEKKLVVTHAGVYPKWTLKKAKKESTEVSRVFKDEEKRKYLLKNMYSPTPNIYDKSLEGIERWRFALNCYTRMRMVYKNGMLDYENSSINPDLIKDKNLAPWFKLKPSTTYKGDQYTVVFGHWAALNAKCDEPHIKALDTGCIWGDRLCAWRYDDDQFFYVKSVGYAEIS